MTTRQSMRSVTPAGCGGYTHSGEVGQREERVSYSRTTEMTDLRSNRITLPRHPTNGYQRWSCWKHNRKWTLPKKAR